MSNPEAGRNPDLITGPIIGSKSLFAAAEGASFKEGPEFSLEIRDPESGFWRKIFDQKSKNYVLCYIALGHYNNV